MRGFLFNEDGYFSVECAIVLSFLVIVFSIMIAFILGVFCGIDDLCENGVSYSGYLPVTIHRVTGVIFETGGEIYAKFS